MAPSTTPPGGGRVTVTAVDRTSALRASGLASQGHDTCQQEGLSTCGLFLYAAAFPITTGLNLYVMVALSLARESLCKCAISGPCSWGHLYLISFVSARIPIHQVMMYVAAVCTHHLDPACI